MFTVRETICQEIGEMFGHGSACWLCDTKAGSWYQECEHRPYRVGSAQEARLSNQLQDICLEGAVSLVSVHQEMMGQLTGETVKLLQWPCCGFKHGNLKDPWSYQRQGS